VVAVVEVPQQAVAVLTLEVAAVAVSVEAHLVAEVHLEEVSEVVAADRLVSHQGNESFHYHIFPLIKRRSISIFQLGAPANIDARIADNSDQALVASLQGLKIKSDDIPIRPGFGKEGKAIKLRANFFPVELPKGPLYEYDVSINPTSNTANRRVKKRIFQLAEQSPNWANFGLRGAVAHDHSSKLISSKLLQQPLTITIPYYDEDQAGPQPNGKEYTLTMEFIQAIDTTGLAKYVFTFVTFLVLSLTSISPAISLDSPSIATMTLCRSSLL